MNRNTNITTFFLLTFGLFLIPDRIDAAETNQTAKKKTRASLVTKMWWNQPNKIASLSLTETQRAEMDQLLEKYLTTHSKNVKKQKVGFEDLAKNLVKADKKKTAKQRDKLAEAIGDDVSNQIDMMSAVFGILSEEQRQLMAEKHAKLINRLWIRTFKPTAMKSKANRKNPNNKSKRAKKQ